MSSGSGQGGDTGSGPGAGGGNPDCFINMQCNDNDACTDDICNQGKCENTAVKVDDGNPCTDDSCDPVSGVAHMPVNTDDGDACTDDSCIIGVGVTHTPVSTDDGNKCTIDSCDAIIGVMHMDVDTSDGNECTVDTCNPLTGVITHAPVVINDNDVCTIDACDPATGAITHLPVDPDDFNECTVDTCNPVTGVSHTPMTCNDNNACTTDTCNMATGCVFTSVSYFDETFVNNMKGWTLGAGWQIGPAMLSSGQTDGLGTDPAQDHTPTADNGIAGTFIGGNIPKVNTNEFIYMTSPVINTAGINGPLFLDFWRVLNSDYPSYMDANVQVFHTASASWVTLFSIPLGGPAPTDNTAANPGWVRYTYDVTAYKGASFQVRFGYNVMNAVSAYTAGGWNIDDLRLIPDMSCP
jgi:hypothetical protein